MSKSTEQLHKDWEILELYYENKSWDLLDSYLTDILSSKDINRQRGVLVLFKSFKNDPIFKDILEKMLKNVESEIGKIY